ncbi:Endonuclease/exonuclease/phosphatase [Ascosphaera apis ARSEF 7405]|uniref:Endonuclease/exonuclease/phosphatase n=1 Tax=Ascosphaera apis ARSEF 7405 TaxID=392613 RepID=A0A168DW38_9EURO|nr:Endonuclease/exonuclease/phosphatase [Ascosphaera apis ARSEF 7405]
MILVQEPWIFSDLTLKRTRAHPGYRVFLPAGPWNRRPRVCTYVKDSLASYASQLQAPFSGQPDLLPVHFHTLTLDFTLWNVYNAPDSDGVVAPRAASTTLLQQSFPNSHILCGDFNFPTGSWLPHQSGTTESERFHDHMLTQDLSALIPSESTHDRGHILDLAWVSGANLAAQCTIKVEPSLEVDSDHRTLLLYLPLSHLPPPVPSALNLSTLRTDSYSASVSRQLTGVTLTLQSASDIDRAAGWLIGVISQAAQESCKQRSNRIRSLPFWTPECQTASQNLRRARQSIRSSPAGAARAQAQAWFQTARSEFRSVFKKARQSHYDTAIAGLSDVGAVSKFTRWHKRPFAAALPPICDPVTGIWAEQSADKHTLFHQAFTNPGYAASDLDNPLLNPVETGRPIEFPALSETETPDIIRLPSEAPEWL